MIGFIVKHTGFGFGKIHTVENGRLSVQFFSPPNAVTLAQGSGLKHAILPQETVCTTTGGRCRILSIIPAQVRNEAHRYKVEFDNGLEQEISETEIYHFDDNSPPSSPLEALAGLQLDGYATFQKRETFAEAFRSIVRNAAGLHALLASRIDLRPHQAYVAGTVLMDRLPRYLLADEVGLGKTIEAGIVIHDFLERMPSARILILCPGTLAQQWLSELYSKFSGRVFSLLDLHTNAVIAGNVPSKTIASFSSALAHSSNLREVKWDLVVIDEAHRLLGAQPLYNLARGLSEASPGCLLLSAIPAQHREGEYLRLLELLDPRRYHQNSPAAEHFKALYDSQIDLGRKLSYILRRLEDFANGVEPADRILQKFSELASLPVLVLDESLATSVASLDANSPDFVDRVRELLHYVGDRYRINRRILRNRRSQLIDSEPDLDIARKLNRIPFEADQLELDAGNAVRNYLQALRDQGIPHAILLPLARCLFQSLCSPVCLYSFVEFAQATTAKPDGGVEFDGDVAYQAWSDFASSLWDAVHTDVEGKEFSNLRHSALHWKNGADVSVRTEALVRFLKARHRTEPNRKFIIFAGFPGLCPTVYRTLVYEFKSQAVACFGWEMDDRIKEKEVLRFNRDNNCWLLVSDETGGEGRNFQFVDELVHFDLPWHVAKVEQRIGRLDRLGRSNPEVCSNVICSSGGEDDGLLTCLQSGFEIFTRSISGLEFALSRLEDQLILAAMTDGYDSLASLVGEIRSQSIQERADDESQGMLDAASLDRRSAEVFQRTQSTPERDCTLEEAFCEYFRFFAGNAAMRQKPTSEFPEGIVEFLPDQIPAGTFLLPTNANEAYPDRRGTFRRRIAQDRPDLEFFSVGNQFFDAVCATLHLSVFGRTYAVECTCDRPVWRGFEFSYVPVGRRDLLDKHPGLLKHLDRVLAVRTGHFFIGEDCNLAIDDSALLTLRKALPKNEHNQSWFNLTLKNGKVQLLEDYYANPGWKILIAQAEKRARNQAKEHFTTALSAVMESEFSRIDEQIRQATVSRTDGWEEEIEGFETLRHSLGGWDLKLDTVGFLSINGGIIQ